MAVVASWFGEALLGQWGATAARQVTWDTDLIKCSLHTSAYAPNYDTDDFWNATSNEITGTGYTTLGVTMSTAAVVIDSGTDEVRLDADDVQWTSATFSAYHAIVWHDDAASSTTSPLISTVDFGGTESVSSGTFTIQWDATGVVKLDYTTS